MKKYGIEFHQLSVEGCVKYPVHYNIQQNMTHINAMIEAISTHYPDKPILLWCSGSSGAMIAGIVASRLKNVAVSHVKKESENAHSSHVNIPSSFAENKLNFIIDDFIYSGQTVNYIYKRMREKYPFIKVDCLVVSSTVKIKNLDFDPVAVISGRLCEPKVEEVEED